jgi:hypothetical protein
LIAAGTIAATAESAPDAAEDELDAELDVEDDELEPPPPEADDEVLLVLLPQAAIKTAQSAAMQTVGRFLHVRILLSSIGPARSALRLPQCLTCAKGQDMKTRHPVAAG